MIESLYDLFAQTAYSLVKISGPLIGSFTFAARIEICTANYWDPNPSKLG
jgi:hypothetical protein